MHKMMLESLKLCLAWGCLVLVIIILGILIYMMIQEQKKNKKS